MSRKLTLLASFLLLPIMLWSQDGQNNTIKNQFEKVIDGSNSFKEFKVIEKVKLHELRKNINDSISFLHSEISNKAGKIEEQQGSIEQLTSQLNGTQEELMVSKQKEDGIELFGTLTKKKTYNTIMWTSIGVLLFLLVVLFFRFKASNSITKATKLKLSETESDFEAHRQKTIENEQVLRRKLQDEINKNRNV